MFVGVAVSGMVYLPKLSFVRACARCVPYLTLTFAGSTRGDAL